MIFAETRKCLEQFFKTSRLISPRDSSHYATPRLFTGRFDMKLHFYCIEGTYVNFFILI